MKTRVMPGFLTWILSPMFMMALMMTVAPAAWAAETERIDLGGGVALELVLVKAGSFTMGSPEGEAGRHPDEVAHSVQIPGDFWLAKTPVTRGQFARFANETRYRTEAEVGNSGGYGFDGQNLVQRKDFTWRNPGFAQTDDHPVVMVTLKDAQAFASWLGRKARRKVALPTEAQWEYACRAGSTTRFYNGDDDNAAGEIAWFKGNAGDGTRPVAQKQPNAFGLCDMSGNVYEWCQDLYRPYRPGAPVQGPMDKPRNVIRGGSWFKDAKNVRSAARYRNTAGSRNADNGFRIVAGPAQPIAVERAEAPAAGNPSRRAESFTPRPPHQAAPYQSPPIQWSYPSHSAPPQVVFHHRSNPFFSVVPVLVVMGLIGMVALIIIKALVKSIGNSTPPRNRPEPRYTPPPPRPATPHRMGLARGVTRIDADGFWFDAADRSPGEVVRFTYDTPQGPMTREFVVEPGASGQYIYTGVRPENLVIGAIVASEMHRRAQQRHETGMHEMPHMPPPLPHETTFEEAVPSISRDDDRPFSGFPSAY